MEKRTGRNSYDFSYTQDRELSWLKFNERVLKEAKDPNVPLMERMKFLSIFTSNLDEFFMVRVGSIYDLSLLKSAPIDAKSGCLPSEQLHAIFKAAAPLYRKRDKIYFELLSQLAKYQINDIQFKDATLAEQQKAEIYFENYIRPVLSPQIIDERHPFPHMINRALYLAVRLKNKGKNYYALLPMPPHISPVFYLEKGTYRFIRIENLLLHFTKQIFSMYHVTEAALLRITRNADISPDDEQLDVEEDYRIHVKKVLKKRERLAPVRMEIQGEISADFVRFFCENIHLKKEQVFYSKAPLDMSYIDIIADYSMRKREKELFYIPFQPQTSFDLQSGESILKQVIKRDILLFYPYESMDTFLRLLQEASEDTSVVSIQITIYRLAYPSKLVECLVKAVQNGIDVLVVMELRARFDEQNNIEWSAELEEAGCRVLYGIEGYKVHSKICLITRRERNRLQYITQIGTGNYNEKTAKLYTDLCLLTANKEIGEDAANFFQNMAISNLDGEYHHLLVAPAHLKCGILQLIDQQIEKGEDGYIFMKMNSLTDRKIIDRLALASQAGVKIELNIRGICCLLPGIAGKTDNITVFSIVGRFLEHARIYRFGKKEEEAALYIGSADMMTRNTQRRVEILTPVLDAKVKKKIDEIIKIMLKDTIKARILLPNGKYEKKLRDSAVALDSQGFFMHDFQEKAQEKNAANMSLWKTIRKNIKKIFSRKIS